MCEDNKWDEQKKYQVPGTSIRIRKSSRPDYDYKQAFGTLGAKHGWPVRCTEHPLVSRAYQVCGRLRWVGRLVRTRTRGGVKGHARIFLYNCCTSTKEICFVLLLLLLRAIDNNMQSTTITTHHLPTIARPAAGVVDTL